MGRATDETRRDYAGENRWPEPTDLKDAAKELAQELFGEAKEGVQEVAQEAKSQAGGVLAEARGAVREATVGQAQGAVAAVRRGVAGPKEPILTTIGRNPVPAVLAGVGLFWLWTARRGAAARRAARWD